MRQLRELEELNLDRNDMGSLQPEICDLPNLKVLSMEGNRLASVPVDIERLASTLLSLNLDNNFLTAFPTQFFSLSRLHELTLQNNKLAAIPSTISRLKSLRILNLASNKIRAIPEGNPPEFLSLISKANGLLTPPPPPGVCKELCAVTDLQQLNLDHNAISVLPDRLSALKELRELTLNDNLISTVPLHIYQLPKLRNLTLDNNPLPPSVTTAHFSFCLTPKQKRPNSPRAQQAPLRWEHTHQHEAVGEVRFTWRPPSPSSLPSNTTKPPPPQASLQRVPPEGEERGGASSITEANSGAVTTTTTTAIIIKQKTVNPAGVSELLRSSGKEKKLKKKKKQSKASKKRATEGKRGSEKPSKLKKVKKAKGKDSADTEHSRKESAVEQLARMDDLQSASDPGGRFIRTAYEGTDDESSRAELTDGGSPRPVTIQLPVVRTAQ